MQEEQERTPPLKHRLTGLFGDWVYNWVKKRKIGGMFLSFMKAVLWLLLCLVPFVGEKVLIFVLNVAAWNYFTIPWMVLSYWLVFGKVGEEEVSPLVAICEKAKDYKFVFARESNNAIKWRLIERLENEEAIDRKYCTTSYRHGGLGLSQNQSQWLMDALDAAGITLKIKDRNNKRFLHPEVDFDWAAKKILQSEDFKDLSSSFEIVRSIPVAEEDPIVTSLLPVNFRKRRIKRNPIV